MIASPLLTLKKIYKNVFCFIFPIIACTNLFAFYNRKTIAIRRNIYRYKHIFTNTGRTRGHRCSKTLLKQGGAWMVVDC